MKINSNKCLGAVVVLAITAGFVISAYAAPPAPLMDMAYCAIHAPAAEPRMPFPRPPGFEPMLNEMSAMPPYLRGIDLSDDQQDKVFAILHAQSPAIRQAARAAREAHRALAQLVISDSYADDTARDLASKVARQHTEIEYLQAVTNARIFRLLTPEQRAQAAEHGDRNGGPENMAR